MAKILKNSRILFYSMVIGDGHLDKHGQLNLRHCIKQKEYLEWKKKLLNRNGIKTSDIVEFISNGKPQVRCATKVYNFSKLYRRILYAPKKRLGVIKLLNFLDPLHIAIWYMDDGSLTILKNKDGYIRGNMLRIHTNVSKEENQILIDFFNKKFNINFYQNKHGNNYVLVCGTKEARKFVEIVRPYVEQVSCMLHKVNNLKATVDSSESKREPVNLTDDIV